MQMKPSVHKSQMGCFSRCQMQYYFRYVENIIAPPAVALITGTGVHKSAAVNLTAKRDTGKLLPVEQVKAAARDAVNEEWDREGVALNAEEKFLGEKVVRGETVDLAVSLAELHHKELAPQLTPTQIERPFTVELNNFPVNISGTIDLQEASSVRDLKTRKNSPPEGLADVCLDITMYSLAVAALDGKRPSVMAMDFLTKTKTPKLVSQYTTRTEASYQAFFRRLEVMARAVEAGNFVPCDPEHWCCSEKFCGYWHKCPFGARSRITV